MRAWKIALSALVVLSLLPACDKLGLGGSKDDESDDDDDSKKKKKKKKQDDDDDDTPAKTAAPTIATPATAPPAVAPPAVAPPTAGGSSGIPECDAYLAKFVQCFPGQENAAEQMRSAWRQAAGGPAAPAVTQSCKQMLAGLNCAGLTPPIDAPPPVVGGVPPPVVAPPPGGRSAVPKVEEWDAQTKEVAVTHSSKLNCETKMVREWLRVSCRGKNFSGGTPTGVTVTKGGGRGDDFTLPGNGLASLVVRFVEGVDLEAQFTWTDRSHVLRVFWPRGAPEPPPKGEFLGL